MSKLKENIPLTIWRNESAILSETSAYKRFIETLKVKFEAVNSLTGKTVDAETFRDILYGCQDIKKAMEKDLNERLSLQSDPDLKSYIQDLNNKKMAKLEDIAKSLKDSLTIKITWFDVYIINPDFILFGLEGDLSFDEEKIIDKHSVKLDSEIRKDVYQKAQELTAHIQSFNELVKEKTNGQYYGLHSYRFTDLQALVLQDDCSVEINPDFIADLKDSSPVDTIKVNN